MSQFLKINLPLSPSRLRLFVTLFAVFVIFFLLCYILLTVVLSCPFVFMKGKMKEIGEFLMSLFIIFYSPKGLEHKDVGSGSFSEACGI